jgi:hypothetical protein
MSRESILLGGATHENQNFLPFFIAMKIIQLAFKLKTGKQQVNISLLLIKAEYSLCESVN